MSKTLNRIRKLAAILIVVTGYVWTGPTTGAEDTPINGDIARPGTIVEHWEGYIDRSVVIHLDLATEDGSTWSAVVKVPSLAGAEVTVSKVSVRKHVRQGAAAQFRAVRATMTCGPWGPSTLSVGGRANNLTGWFTIGGEFFALKLRQVPPEPRALPLEPWQPERPLGYRAEEVAFRNGPLTIAGELTVPSGGGPHPALLFLGGGSSTDRDGNQFAGQGVSHYRYIADQLTRRGFAVLRTDDRGVGGSTGQRDTVTLEDLAGDAIAAVEYLAARPDLRADRISLVGHSQGASVAPIVATRTPAVSYVVLLSPEAVVGAVGALEQDKRDAARATGASKEAAEQDLELDRLTFALLLDGVPPPEIRRRVVKMGRFSEETINRGIKYITKNEYQFRYDPGPVLSRVTVPALAVYFGQDDVIPIGLNEPALRKAIARGQRSNFTIKVFPDLGHGMYRPSDKEAPPLPTAQPFPELEVLAYVSNWLRTQGGGPSREAANETVE